MAEMAAAACRFRASLYAGLMIKDGQARLVEYNVRFRRSRMPGADDAAGRSGAGPAAALPAPRALATHRSPGRDDHALTVVMAADGYPGRLRKGTQIKVCD